MTRINMTSVAVAMSALLAACSAVGPDYQRPNFDLPNASAKATVPASAAQWLTWWKVFEDPALNALLDEAAANNQDLALATGRLEEARAVAGVANAALFPTVDGGLAVSKARTSEAAGKLGAGANPISKDYQASLTAAYEIDLWGKLRRGDEAARARLLASAASRGTMQASLFAYVAQSYFSLRALDAQLSLAEQTLATRQDNLRLQNKRFAAGAVGELDLRQAEAEAAAAEVTLRQTRQTLRNLESALAVLLGRRPAQISQPVIARGRGVDQLLSAAKVPGDLPSDLLQRRPDLRAAEQALMATNADIGQAKSQYFPTLRLTAALGHESRALSDLLDPASMLWNLGVGLTQPIFRGGAVDAVVAGANARKAQATAQYVQAVQAAFKDVHDALEALSANQDVVQATQRRIDAIEKSKRLVDLRYAHGYNSQLEVLNAQRDLFAAQSAMIEAKRGQLAASVALYKAMGGGWDATGSTVVGAR